MRIQNTLVIAAALALTLPLSAAHRHGRDCGHIFDSHRGSWISVQILTPFGHGIINRGFDRYDDRRHRDSRHFKQKKKFFKKLQKQRLRDHRRFHNQRRHVHGPACWR